MECVECPPFDGEPDVNDLASICRITSWRNTSKSNVGAKEGGSNRITDTMLQRAEFMESWLQSFRKKKLGNVFGHGQSGEGVREYIYCDDEVHSQMNRCLIASDDRHVVEDFDGDGDGCSKVNELCREFVALLDSRAEKFKDLLPADIRPKGLVSTKFEWDGKT